MKALILMFRAEALGAPSRLFGVKGPPRYNAVVEMRLRRILTHPIKTRVGFLTSGDRSTFR